MEERPRYVAFAATTALIGAFFALVVIILGLDLGASGFELRIGFGLLILVLFIAVAGSLNPNGQWSWRFLIFIEVLCTAVPMLAFLFEVMDFLFAVTFVVLACLTILFTTTSQTRRWIEADRV